MGTVAHTAAGNAYRGLIPTGDVILDKLLEQVASRIDFIEMPRTCENGFHDDVSVGSNFGKDRRDVGMSGFSGTVTYFKCNRCSRVASTGRFA